MMQFKKKYKLLTVCGCVLLFTALAIFFLSGGNYEILKSLFFEEHTNEELREKLASFGVRGHITVVILSMLQVLVSFLPAEPVQVLSGVTFGFPVALLCCTVGVLLGNSMIFVLYRVFGEKIRDFFMKNLHFDFEKAANSGKVTFIIFILYFLPAIPYGMICFFAASLGMKYPRYIIVTLLGSIPSICIGVGLGHVAIAYSWILSAVVFVVLIALLTVLMIKKDAVFAKVNAYMDRPPYSSKTTVRSYGPIVLPVAYVISRIVFFFKGVRVKYINKLGHEIESPSIVLCNHGSFVDFAYAGSLIYKKRPNFVVARLYFYKKLLGTLLKRIGCFPKSMFAADLESAKNCLRVLKNDGVLAMMPEARLSTVGRFEDIQAGTYSFLKKANVPIYSIKICGDYFADPKWGNGLRRGAVVEAELDLLIAADELETLTVEQIRERVESRLYYDEFLWLAKHPSVHYRSKTLAKGLENILMRCPVCHKTYTLSTQGRDIICDCCGKLATLTDRYGFVGDTPFANFAEWYDWQKDCLRQGIEADPNYCLTSKVAFHLPSTDGKTMLRKAGDGVCRLTRAGLTYEGECDGETCKLFFPIEQIYRLLFGAGENFEVYVGNEIHYFVPEEKRSAVEWYLTSMLLYDAVCGNGEQAVADKPNRIRKNEKVTL